MEEILRATCGVVFMVAWFIGVGAILFTVAEMIAVLGFAQFAFATGKVLVRIEEPLIVRPAALSPQGMTSHASYRLINGKRCLFRESGSGLLLFRLAGPVFLKGTIDIATGRAVTVGRLALGPSILCAAFLAGWTAGSLGLLLQEGWPAFGGVMVFLVLGWGVLGLLVTFSITFARRRFHQAYGEVKDALRPTIRL
jgi:hypothetical protein